MIDYNYYKTEYDGHKIDHEEEFEKYKKVALKYINFATNGKGEESEIAEAVCALCDLYFDTDIAPGVTSERVDGMAVTYDSDAINKKAYQLLKLYLPSRIMYRGL